MFSSKNDPTGASKLKLSVAVPTTPPTVTSTARITSYKLPSASHSALARHCTELAELHDAVEHTALTSCAVAVYSLSPKLSPLTVTDAPKLCGMFSSKNDPTGASNENTPYPVPTTPATVISAVSASPATLICWHTTDVAELHDDVLHGADPSAAVAV